MNDLIEFVKAMVRPFVQVTGWSLCCYMWLNGVSPPVILLGILFPVTGEYWIERAIKRFRE